MASPIRIHEHLLDFFITFFALSSLTLWGVLFLGGSFKTLAVLMLAVPFLAGYLVKLNSRGPATSASVGADAGRSGNQFDIGTLAVFVLLVLLVLSTSGALTLVLLLVAVCLLILRKAPRPWSFADDSALEKSPFMLGGALVIAVVYTLVSHRSDPDDAFYLFFGLLPLNQPAQAMNLFPMYDTARMLVSYPALEAVVSYWTGIDFLQVYYLIVPALAAMLAVLAYYLLYQRLNCNYAGILTLMTVVILIVWAGKHQSPGNDAFVRLYQGKSIFHAMLCPYLIGASIGVLRRLPGSKFRLAIACISGIGLTQSALVLLPLYFSGLALTAWVIYREPFSRARYLPFLLGIISLLALAIVIIASTGSFPVAQNPRFDSLREALDFRYGDGLRGYLGIASLCILPLFAGCIDKQKAVVATIAGIALIALNPIVVFLVAKIAWSLAWRLQWLIPVAATVSVGIFLVSDLIARGKPQLRLLLCGLGLFGFAMLGQTTFSNSNRNAIGIPQIKPPATINGVFERHHNGRYKLHAEYRLQDGLICMTNGCY